METHTQIVVPQKLYIVIRGDLNPGAQIAQAAHACFAFALKHPEITKEWNEKSNYIAVLSVKDEDELRKLQLKLEIQGLKFASFYEEDFDNSLTAIAIEPGDQSRKLTSSYPLALKNLKVS